MTSVIVIFIAAAFVAALAVFAYYLIYTRKINKKIISGEVAGKKLVDIPKAVMIAVISLLTVYCVILSGSLKTAAENAGNITRNNYAVINVSDPQNYKYISYFGNSNLDDASFAKIYSVEENEGYSKEVIKDGNFTFTVFKRTSPADDFHPDFLCFAEYTGAKSDELRLYSSASFSASNGSMGGGSSMDLSDKLLFIGNIDDETDFNASLYILDEKSENEFSLAMQKAETDNKSIFPSEKDFAIESGKVTVKF